jgi:hypothetical protein
MRTGTPGAADDPRAYLNSLANMICYVLNGKSPEPAQVGFALFVFPLGQAEGGYIDYLSNADRTDMMLALREFLAKQEGRTITTEVRQ